MTFNLGDCTFLGPALPEPFVKFELEGLLRKHQLLPSNTGVEGKNLQKNWDAYRRKLRALGERGGPIRVANHILEPLVEYLGYASIRQDEEVKTREGVEDAGWLISTADNSARLRVWAVDVGTDLDAPNKRGRAYRFSPSRIAQRVLLAKNERVGLLTDGDELRILICDPARPDSHIAVRLDRAGGWRGAHSVPDSFRLLISLATPAGIAKVPDLTDQARLSQTEVTTTLRKQARQAVEGFVQEILDNPSNDKILADWTDKEALAKKLWSEGLILVYRLLFVFKLESSADPARAFSFASTSLWRNTYSPNTALARHARSLIDKGADTGRLLEEGLRSLFRLFSEGLSSSELRVSPLGGMLFGRDSTELIDDLLWGERAVAILLDRLLWTPGEGKIERQRVHYGPLDVEDLGRVYEALLELEPGIASQSMCRLRRDKLEVVVSVAQGELYKNSANSKKKTEVEWIEEIPEGRFFLRVGLGRKASGSYYTPHAFVRFLVQETLGPQVAERSPADDPRPAEILKLKVLDPAMGSGHFLVEACRFLGEKLYEACRLCDERALEAEQQADKAGSEAERNKAVAKAQELRKRVEDLPDPDDELVAYLPSRVPEGEESGLSQWKALALSRRLVAVHCLYGVDKNSLAVGLAKLSLWLESYAEGLPLTFLDHRLIYGDSLTGPFFEHLLTYPGSGKRIEGLFVQGLTEQLSATLNETLILVKDLEASVGKDVADIENKRVTKERLESALEPFKLLAAAWSGGVMIDNEQCDDFAYESLLNVVTEKKDIQSILREFPRLQCMVNAGKESVGYDLVFPEIFFPLGSVKERRGFDVVIGNPPWDAIQFKSKEFLASFDLRILDAPTKLERDSIEKQLLADEVINTRFKEYQEAFESQKRINDRLFKYQKVNVEGDLAGRQLDAFRVFMERNADLLKQTGFTGVIVPSGFHSNAGATGIRRLYLNELVLKYCFSFENSKKLFDIHASFKFAAVVAQKRSLENSEFLCAFYLHDLDWLFKQNEPLTYTLDFVQKTGGEYLSFLELRSPKDADIAKACFESVSCFHDFYSCHNIRFSSELHMANDSWRFTPIDDILFVKNDPRDSEIAKNILKQGYLSLLEGKNFHQYNDHWDERPRYLVELAKLNDKPNLLKATCYYRLGFRDIASSTNERTGIFTIAPPLMLFGHTAVFEREPSNRPNIIVLLLQAAVNSFCFDWPLRQKSSTHVSLFILDSCPFPFTSFSPSSTTSFLVHSSLRLTCNHEGYAPLWHEQVSNEWREPKPMYSWPILVNEDERWLVRVNIDAIIADAYGLSREQYEYILSTFSHKSYPKAPALCLAAFDELKTIGLDTFTKKYDPYWDIPLNKELPKPVIKLPIISDETMPTGRKSKKAKKEQLSFLEE